MELKNYEFIRSVVFQGKFSAAPGDTLMQTAEEMFVYSGRRGTQEVLLRTRTISTYITEGWLKELVGLDEPGEEPKITLTNQPPDVTERSADGLGHSHQDDSVPALLQEMKGFIEGDRHEQLMGTFVKNESQKSKPKPDPVVVPKPIPAAKPKTTIKPKPTTKPTPSIKTVVPQKPIQTNPIIDAALSEPSEAVGIDDVLARNKKVVRKGR